MTVLQNRYEELKKQNFPDSERIKFIADLGASEEIEYHYQLICTDWDEGMNLNLSGSFYKHDKEGLEYLFEVLHNEDDENLKVFTAYLMAETLSKLRHRDFYVEFCNRLIPAMSSLIEIRDDLLRRKVIIALGWIGSSDEIEILTKQAFVGHGLHQVLCKCYFMELKKSYFRKRRRHVWLWQLLKKTIYMHVEL